MTPIHPSSTDDRNPTTMIGRLISGRLRAAAVPAPARAWRLSSSFFPSPFPPGLPSTIISRPSRAHLRFAPSAGSDVAEEDLVFVDPPPAPQNGAAAAPTVLQPRVLVYDGVCHLCHRGVKWVIKADKYEKIKFCCLQSKAAEPYLHLCGLDREDVLRRVLFVEGPESYYQGSTAALKVASYLPYPYAALSALLIIPAPLRDVIYDHIAKRRYGWFGKEDRCIVRHDNELLHRFIDRDELFGGWNENDFHE